MTLLSNKSLKITGMTEEDIGEYRCKAILANGVNGMDQEAIVSQVFSIYIPSNFPWWIILIAVVAFLLVLFLLFIVYRAKKRRSHKGYYDVSDIEATGKKHNKSDIYYMPEDVDGDSIMNENDNIPLDASTPNKTPIFTPKTIRHLNNLESTTGSVGSLLEDDEFLKGGMDEDGSFRERYAE